MGGCHTAPSPRVWGLGTGLVNIFMDIVNDDGCSTGGDLSRLFKNGCCKAGGGWREAGDDRGHGVREPTHLASDTDNLWIHPTHRDHLNWQQSLFDGNIIQENNLLFYPEMPSL